MIVFNVIIIKKNYYFVTEASESMKHMRFLLKLI